MVKKLKQIKEEIGKKEKEIESKKIPPEIEREVKVEFPEKFRQMILQTIDWTFNVIAKREGEHWKLESEELQALGDSYVALAEKYLPEGTNRFSVEINVILWTAIIVLKRIVPK